MAQGNVCSFNKYGFCKFRLNCRRQHVMKKCEQINCGIQNCSFRHPRVCRYFTEIGFCKFGEWCLFEHTEKVNGDQEIVKLKTKIKGIEEVIKEKSEQIESLEKILIEKDDNKSIEEVLTKMETKLETFELQLSTMKNCLLEKDDYIHNLESRVKDMEEKLEKIDKIQTNEQKIQILIEKVSNLENCLDQKTSEKFKCKKCDFETHSERGLKNHMSRKHTQISSEEYPKKCDLCELELDNVNDFKKHLRTHSYKEAKFKCQDCNFVGKRIESMDVHIGKSHTDNFECGICEVSFGKSEDLEIHLATCEIYKCNCHSCDYKQIKLADIKEHLKNEHGGGKYLQIQHLKISRMNHDEVASNNYYLNDI